MSGMHLLRWRGRQLGPFSRAVIEQKLDEMAIGLFHEVQHHGEWITVAEYLERTSVPQGSAAGGRGRAYPGRAGQFPLLPAEKPESGKEPVPVPPPRPPGAITTESLLGNQVSARKKRWVFVVLGVLIGYGGLHNFYAGHLKRGAGQLLLTVVTVLAGYGVILAWIWALVDVVLVRKDSLGRPFK